MIRNLKALGLALGAVFALSAAMASSASAIDTFTSSVTPAVVTGEPHSTDAFHKFEVTLAKPFSIECATSKFSGTFKSGASQVTIFPTYTGTKEKPTEPPCKSTLGTATVDMNECSYDLTGKTTNEHPKGSGKFDAVVWVTCPAGKEITITGPLGCTIHIHTQTPTEGGVTYTNETTPGGKKDIKIHATVTGITYSTTNACTIAGFPTEGNNADYTGTVTAECFEDKGPGVKYDEFKEGAQVDCEVSSS